MAAVKVQRQTDEPFRDLNFSTLDSSYDGVQQSYNTRQSNINISASHGKSLKVSSIIDIRAEVDSSLDLGQQCLEGLQQAHGEKYLPSLLLWDEQGQLLYDEILKNDSYYLFKVEQELLKHRVDDFAQTVADSGVETVVELGAGNMHKTTLILSALDRLGIPLIYYALDVDSAALEQSIAGVRSKISLKNIELKGLWGTYSDGAKWLSCPENHQGRRQAILWLGSTIANSKPSEAGAVLRSFVNRENPQILAGIIFGMDSCRDVPTLQGAYDTSDGATRRWMWHALEGAREQLGPASSDLLNANNWRLDLRWEPEHSRFENYLVATKPLRAKIGEVMVELDYDEHVRVIGSGKWDESYVRKICMEQELQIAHRWRSPRAPYDLYWLKPAFTE